MGILIKGQSDLTNLILNTGTDFLIETVFLNSLENFFIFSKRINELNKSLEQKSNSMRNLQAQFEQLKAEQLETDKKIKELIDLKKKLYGGTIETFGSYNFKKYNEQINSLLQEQAFNSAKISQILLAFKRYNKITEGLKKEIELFKDKIDLTKQFIDIEYSKLDFGAAESARLVLSDNLEKMQDERIKHLLKDIVRNNFELEKLMIKLINKIYNDIQKNSKYQKLCVLLEQIEVLVRINEKVYILIDELSISNELTEETSELLRLLLQLLEQVYKYVDYSLYKQKTLNISVSIKMIKDASTLVNKNVIKGFKPMFLYKKRIEKYSSRFKVINDIIMEVEQYLTPGLNQEVENQKVYLK